MVSYRLEVRHGIRGCDLVIQPFHFITSVCWFIHKDSNSVLINLQLWWCCNWYWQWLRSAVVYLSGSCADIILCAYICSVHLWHHAIVSIGVIHLVQVLLLNITAFTLYSAYILYLGVAQLMFWRGYLGGRGTMQRCLWLSVPWLRVESGPWQWKPRILTTSHQRTPLKRFLFF